MTVDKVYGIDSQLNDLFQNAKRLSSSDKIWDLYSKAESISGLDLLLKNRKLKATVLNQDAISVLQWLINKIEKSDDVDLETTKSIYFLVGLVSNHSDFWSLLKTSGIKLPQCLFDHSKLILSNFSTYIHFELSTDYHKEERREYLRKIVADNNWERIYDEYHRNHENYEHSICYSLKSAFTLLYYYETQSLMSILDAKNDIPFLWGMMALMGKSNAMTIALETTNSTLKFCALSSVLPFSGKDSFNEYEAQKLGEVFLDIMTDEIVWQHWMKILNNYPSRYPHIQVSLGESLARAASKNAIQYYFEVIHLYAVDFHDTGRKSVAECLESFSQLANEEVRKIAWNSAFEIWDRWDFGVKDKDGHLFEIKASALDYAITKYYLECCDSKDRKAKIDKLNRNLNNIDNVWHQTSSKYTTYWYLQKSRFQPLYHAEQVSLDIKLPCLMQDSCYIHNHGDYENYIQYMVKH
tara:strand:+ start:194 stop:1594 length:1401 start_codon:yes stop_codon:yes gene_type:complete